MYDILMHTTHFAVSALAEEHEVISRRFADPNAHGFDGASAVRTSAGIATIGAAIACLGCRIIDRLPGGDHTIVVGEVLEAAASEGRPLLYYRGGYTQLGR